MNAIIMDLLEQRTKKETEIKRVQHELDTIIRCICDEMHKETNLINKVLKHNVIEIINMIHECDLKCSAINNTETIWGNTTYKVSDGTYFVNIIAKEGAVSIDYSGIDNNGGGRFLAKRIKDLIAYKILPFCEAKKNEYN